MHEAASDPHPQYDTAAEVATRVSVHEGLADVHNSFHDVTLSPYSADKTGVTEATTAIAAAITAASAGQEVYLPAGTYLIDKLTIDKRLRFRGDGKNATILKAKTGATGPLFNWNNSTLRAGSSMRGLTFDMSLAPTIDALYLHNLRNGVVDDLYFGPIAGDVALHADLVQGMTFSNIDVFNATTAGFKGTHGSSSGNRFISCFTDNTTVTGVYGFLFDGGLDWWCIGCTSFRAPGSLIHLQYGYAWDYTTPNYNCTGKILGSTADAIMDLTEDSSVSAAMLFKGVGNCDVVDNFVGAYSVADGVSVPAVVLDDTKNMRFASNRFGGHGVVFRGTSSDVTEFIGNNFLFGTTGCAGFYVLTTQPTNVYEEGSYLDHYSVDTPPLASDAAKWRIATGSDPRKAIRVSTASPVDGDFAIPPPEGTFSYNDTLSRLHIRNSGGIYPYAQLTAEQTFYLGASTDDLSVLSTTTKARLRETAASVTYTQKSVVTDTSDATSYATSSFGPTNARDYLIFVLNVRSSSPTAINSITHTSLGSLSELASVTSTDGTARLSVWKGRSTATTSGALTVDFGGVTQSACAIRPYEVANDANSVSTFATAANSKTANATISPLTLTFGIEPVDHSVIAMGAKATTTAATVGTGYTEKTTFSLADSVETWAGEVKTKDSPDSSFTFTFSGTGEVMGIAVKVLLPTSTPTLSGLTGGIDGRSLTVANASTQNVVTLKHQSGSSAANQLTLTGSADYTLAASSSVPFLYDAATSKWIQQPSGSAPTAVDYLVGTASADLSAEIVVGTTPGGELGNTWASPTVDATHAGGTHLTLGTSPSTQAIGDSAAGGSATDAAKTDHKHAMPAFATNALALGTAAAAGSATTLVRSDATIAAFDATAATNNVHGNSATTGSATAAARRDHTHGLANLSGDVTTTDTMATTLAHGSASNLDSGTLPAGRLPALTGNVTSSAGSAATTLAAGSASVLDSGTLLAARMPALTGNVTTSAGAVATTIASAVVTGPMLAVTPGVRPNANALLGWLTVPETCSTARTPAAAIIYLTKIMVPTTITVTNVLVSQSTAGTSYTNAQLGLYSSAGTLLGSSVVQASAGTNGFGAAAPNIVTLPLTVVGGQSLTVTGGETAFCWAALHMGTNSSTSAVFQGTSGSSTSLNAGLTASTARVGAATGHATNNLATIGNLTPSGFSITNSTACIWMGVS